MLLQKLALISTRGSHPLPHFRSSASFVLFLPLAPAAIYTCERAKCINLSPPEYMRLEEFCRRAQVSTNCFNIILWCLVEKPYQWNEVSVPGSPVKSSYLVSYTSGLWTGGEGAIKNLVTGLTAQHSLDQNLLASPASYQWMAKWHLSALALPQA